MLPQLTTLIETEILKPAALLFGLDPNSIRSLGGFENYVAESSLDDRPVILRVSNPDRRTLAEIQAELEFIAHLSKNNVPVSNPIRSLNNKLIEQVNANDKSFVISCFEKAKGRLIKRDEMTDAHLINRGRALGQLHKHSRTFKPSSGIDRIIWYDDKDFKNARDIIPKDDAVVADRLDEIIERLTSFGRDDDRWGLCHFDAHHGNILFDGTQPTLIDFDDACYGMFVSDLAIPLFYHILSLDDPTPRALETERYVRAVLKGYQEHFPLDPNWPEIFPLVLRRREIILYVAIHRAMDINNLGEWGTKYMDGRKQRIVERAPFVDFDFAKLTQSLNG